MTSIGYLTTVSYVVGSPIRTSSPRSGSVSAFDNLNLRSMGPLDQQQQPGGDSPILRDDDLAADTPERSLNFRP